MVVLSIIFTFVNIVLLGCLFFGDTNKYSLMLAKTLLVFLCEYVIMAHLLFVIGQFSIFLCCLLSFLLSVVLAVVIVRLKGGYSSYISRIKIPKKIGLSKRGLAIIFIGLLCCSILPEVEGKDYSVNSYQFEAVQLMNGDSNIRADLFPEYDEHYDKITPIELYNTLTVYEQAYNYYPYYKVTYVPGTGIFSNSPSYASLFALSGQTFGREAMTMWNLFFLFGIATFVYEIAGKLGLSEKGRLIALAGSIIMPNAVWYFKSATPIPAFMLIASGMLYFAIDNYLNRSKDTDIDLVYFVTGLVACVAIDLKSVWFIPLGVLILCLISSAQDRLYQTKLSLVASIMCVILSGSHFFVNYHAYRDTFLVVQNSISTLFSLALPMIIPCLCCLLCIVALLKPVRSYWKKYMDEGGLFYTSKIVIACTLIMTLIYVWKLIAQNHGSFSETLNVSFVAVMLLTGIIIIPLVLYYLFFRTELLKKHKGIEIVVLLFALGIMVQMIAPNYYVNDGYLSVYSITPFMFTIFLLFAAIGDELKHSINVSAVALVLILPFLSYAITTKPLTEAAWSDIDSISEFLASRGDNVAVVFDSSATDIMIPLKQTGLTNVDFYVQGEKKCDRLPMTSEDYHELYDDVLYLCRTISSDEDDGQIFTLRSSVISEETCMNQGKILPFPTYMDTDSYTREYRIFLYSD